MPLFGTSGIRRKADRELIELALQVGMAVGKLYPEVIVGRDTRTSGSAMRHAITSGLLAAGARCSDAGVVPTPTLGFVAREFKAGIMITASHNPPQYNGLKLLNPDGSAFSEQQQLQIEEMIEEKGSVNIRWDRMLSGEVYSTAVEKHVSRILQAFPGGVKLKVVIDAGCGAAYFITPFLFNRLGCEVTAINCYSNGIFPHDVEPIEANLEDLINTVKSSGADLGIAHDGDADRMMAVDDRGRFISGDQLMAILAGATNTDRIVTTIDASMSIEERGVPVARTRVGDPYVSEELKMGGNFGGEPSGAWVFPKISLCPDGIFAAALIASIAGEKHLSQFVDEIPVYPVIRGSVPGVIEDQEGLRLLLQHRLNPRLINEIDGFKLVFEDGWILVRPSGTEPKVRLTAEAKSQEQAREYYEQALESIKSLIK
jgi:phosphoglucosamine mutase